MTTLEHARQMLKEKGEITTEELALRAGVSRRGVHRTLQTLREFGLYTAEWRHVPGGTKLQWYAIYKLGGLPDVPHPTRIPVKQKGDIPPEATNAWDFAPKIIPASEPVVAPPIPEQYSFLYGARHVSVHGEQPTASP